MSAPSAAPMSVVENRFTNAVDAFGALPKLPNRLLEPGVIPGLGEASIDKLKSEPYNIDSCSRLYAVYFNHDRQTEPTIDYLVDRVRIQRQYAVAAVSAMHLRLGTNVL